MMLMDGEVPLLLEMSLPSSHYYLGMGLFPRILFYANAVNDHTVNYVTASLSEGNKYRSLKAPPPPISDRYRFIVAEELVTSQMAHSSPASTTDDDSTSTEPFHEPGFSK